MTTNGELIFAEELKDIMYNFYDGSNEWRCESVNIDTKILNNLAVLIIKIYNEEYHITVIRNK